jgi:hypothetical protein
MYN